jgi:hypothetical protein
VDNTKNKHLVLKVVNGVAKWVDVRDTTEPFIRSKHNGFVPSHSVEENSPEHHAEELE